MLRMAIFSGRFLSRRFFSCECQVLGNWIRDWLVGADKKGDQKFKHFFFILPPKRLAESCEEQLQFLKVRQSDCNFFS